MPPTHHVHNLVMEMSWMDDGSSVVKSGDIVECQSPSTSKSSSSDGVFLEKSVFEDEVLGRHFVPPNNYEGKHRFDPRAIWTAEEENKLIRKIDWRIMVFACLCFFALQLDRGNLSNALSDNLLEDLHMTTDDYNTGNTLFFVSFLIMEIPSQLVSKRIGVERWVPIQMIIWSAVAASQCLLSSKQSFWATRVLLGLFEGGFIPDMVLWLSYFYKSEELPIRLSWFWGSSTAASILGALLASAILDMRGVRGWAGWRWLFLIEGAVTLAVGVFALFYMPPSPTQTKSSFRGPGWFNIREETVLVTRVLRDDPTKSEMHNRQPITFEKFWRSLCDYDIWPIYALAFMVFIPGSTVTAYFSLNMKALGFSTFNTNVLSIPGSFLSILTLLGAARLAEWSGHRAIISSLLPIWEFPFFVALLLIPDSTNPWVKYALYVLIVMRPDCQAIMVGWTSRNSGSVRTRSLSASLYNIMCQLGNLVSSNIYRTDDKPYYHRGNRVLLAINVVNIVLYYLVKFYYVKRNQHRARIWDAMTLQQQDEYLSSTNDRGNKRLDFRFAH